MKIKQLSSLFIAAVILNLFFSIPPTPLVYAEEAEKIEKVVVSGFGINPEKAKENAIRNAVEQVIGAYVASESIVKNSQLLKDEILSYSGGYLKETKIDALVKSITLQTGQQNDFQYKSMGKFFPRWLPTKFAL